MQMPACKVRKHKQTDQGVFQFAAVQKKKVKRSLKTWQAKCSVVSQRKAGDGKEARQTGRGIPAVLFSLLLVRACTCVRAIAQFGRRRTENGRIRAG